MEVNLKKYANMWIIHYMVMSLMNAFSKYFNLSFETAIDQ